MSNERIIRTAAAVEDLAKALEIWCDGQVPEPMLAVRGEAVNAVVAVDAALHELHLIRDITVAQLRDFDAGTAARADALLGSNYQCGDCGRVFVIDPGDPMTAHGNYLDHMDEHERTDHAGEAYDPAELAVPANPAFESPEVPR